MPVPAGAFELVLRPDPGLFDGRFANSGWLQEMPKPLTKIVWDNVAHLSPKTAEDLGVKNEDVVELEANGRRLALPVWILPGQPDGVVTVHLGFGRTRAGRVGNGVGANAYLVRTSAALWNATCSLRRTGATVELASTQQHFNMEGRHLVRTGTYETFRKDPEFAKKMEEVPEISLYPAWKYEHHAWGLAVNLSSCTGCSACVVACQAENNIPTVGKDQVRRGREMHWLRIDRYYEGTPENPAAHNQPVMCMHCEKAPCEVVCPVAATTHSDEGINEMTYNRCIGTKYCSNNCPYKVRRFNFFDYNKDKHLPVLTLLANPNVTVRQKGVMEKCNYCIQRVNRARIAAEKENRRVRDGEVVTACQQACPTEALVFGDLNDPTSRAAKMRKDPLEYPLLGELNTRPRTTYLAKLTNPNPAFGEELMKRIPSKVIGIRLFTLLRRSSRVSSDVRERRAPPVIAPGLHARDGHRQDQRRRPEQDAEVVVPRLRRLVPRAAAPPHHDGEAPRPVRRDLGRSTCRSPGASTSSTSSGGSASATPERSSRRSCSSSARRGARRSTGSPRR